MLKALAFAAALAAFSAGAAQAQAPSVTGSWICQAGCQVMNGVARIEQFPNFDLALVNETGGISRGQLGMFNGVVAIDWNMFGTLSPDGTAIDWSNGGRWVRLTR